MYAVSNENHVDRLFKDRACLALAIFRFSKHLCMCNISAIYFYFPCQGIDILPHAVIDSITQLRHHLTLSPQHANSISVETLNKGLPFSQNLLPLHDPSWAFTSWTVSMRLAVQASPGLHTLKDEDLEYGKQMSWTSQCFYQYSILIDNDSVFFHTIITYC